ncbi:hypothetical protein B9K06_05390 [Bacillus sp. OG2]|nr:hypothetical protein B9K06_05390 [Bacillus sp. OG2]
MDPLNIVGSILQNRNSGGPKPLALSPGQIVSAKVIKLHPNQTAEVMIGGQKVIAQLETALSVNERYWLQVLPGDGAPRLRLLPGAEAQKGMNAEEVLLNKLALAAAKTNIDMVSFLVKEQLPITKEGLSAIAEWLGGSRPSQNQLEAIKQALARQLPVSGKVLDSLMAAQGGKPIQALLTELVDLLDQPGVGTSGKALLHMATDLGASLKMKQVEESLSFLVKEWLGSQDGKRAEGARHLLEAAGALPKGLNEADLLQRILVSSGQAGRPAGSLEDLLKAFAGRLQGNMHRSSNESGEGMEGAKTAQNASMSNSDADIDPAGRPASAALQPERTAEAWKGQLFSALAGRDMKPAEAIQLLRILHPQMPEFEKVSESIKLLTESDPEGQGEKSMDVRQVLLGEISAKSAAAAAAGDGLLQSRLTHILKSLGYSHDHSVLSFLSGGDDSGLKNESLKMMLLQFLKESPPIQHKEAAEQLLNKLTGHQLLAQETGPLQQYIFQLPVPLWNRTAEMTMQWSGRKLADGRIDPAYCRVIFYLDLDHLKETIVDVQVQNRIVQIKVFNGDSRIREWAAPFTDGLKKGLEELDYRLSSIVFEKGSGAQPQTKGMAYQPLSDSGKYSGVDIKI